jgi:hypothetical protein
VLGKGIVLGKYTKKLGDSKKVTDYDTKDIAGPDSQAYQDAYKIAMQSGHGASDIFLAPEEMIHAVVAEDTPHAPMLQTEISVPKVPKTPTVAEATADVASNDYADDYAAGYIGDDYGDNYDDLQIVKLEA